MEKGDQHPDESEGGGMGAGPEITPRQERLVVALVLITFVALAIGFSLGPIFEGQDEIEHYRFVRLLANTWQLPDRSALYTEYHQPPLFYALGALIKMNVADADFDDIEARWRGLEETVAAQIYVPNWQAQPGNDTNAIFSHGRDEEYPYPSDTARAVHLIRLQSVILGISTVVTCYRIAWLLWPDDAGSRLRCLGIVAFWPVFDYVSGYITNDTLIIFLSTLALYLTLRQIRYGPSMSGAVLLGAVLGSALLSKANALLLAGPVGLTMLFDWRRTWRYGLVTLATSLAMGGWWYVRAAIVDGDPTGLLVQYRSYPDLNMPLGTVSFAESLALMGHIYTRLWARFGWRNHVVVAPLIYIFFDGLTLAGVAGALVSGMRWFRQARNRLVGRFLPRMVAVLASMGLVTLLGVYVFSTTNRGAAISGRYLIPAICVWSSLLAYGIGFWIPHRLRLAFSLGGMVVLAIVAATCLLKYYLPAYRPLPLPPTINHPVAIRYESAAELIGVEETSVHVRPGEVATLTLYWRAIQPTEHDVLVFVHSKDSNPLAMMKTPATGNLRSSEWQPGQAWAERWQVLIPADTPSQTVIPIGIALRDMVEQRNLVPEDEDGRITYPIILQIVVDGS